MRTPLRGEGFKALPFSFLRPASALARRCGVRGASQVLYRPGRGNGELKARVPVARRRHGASEGDERGAAEAFLC